jgi:hypothetical protein
MGNIAVKLTTSPLLIWAASLVGQRAASRSVALRGRAR